MEVVRRRRQFPLVVLPSSLMVGLENTIPLPILASLYGPSAAGHFLIAQRIAALPSGFVTASVNDVLHSRMAELYLTEPHQMRQRLIRIIGRLAAISAAIYLPLAVA